MPHPGLLHPEPLPLWQATADPYLLRRHPNTVLSQSLGGLWVLVSTGIFEPSERCWWVWGLILNAILPLLPSCWGFSFTPGCGVSPQSRSAQRSCRSSTAALFYWAWPRPSKQNPVSPSVSLSHQEVSINFLSLSIRGQTE